MMLKLTVDFDFFKAFDDVTDFEVVVSGNRETAVIAREDFFDVVFEAFERAEVACVADDTFTNQAHFAATFDFAFANDSTCNCTDF